jgi:hypothetical protein
VVEYSRIDDAGIDERRCRRIDHFSVSVEPFTSTLPYHKENQHEQRPEHQKGLEKRTGKNHERKEGSQTREEEREDEPGTSRTNEGLKGSSLLSARRQTEVADRAVIN